MLKISAKDYAEGAIQGDRASQQDAHAVLPWPGAPQTKSGGLLLALADGMGGHEGGAEAARIAIHVGTDTVLSAPNNTPLAERLHAGVLAANEAVGAARATHDETYDGMGCTLVLAAIDGTGVSWASVGDSPLFLARGAALIRLNRDHSMTPTLAYMVQQGELTADEAASDPRRHQLRSALTGETLNLIDSAEPTTPLKPGDRLVLASDGLLGLHEDQMVAICQSTDTASSLSAQLLTSVRAEVTSGLDNTSVIVYVPRKWGWF